MVRRLRVAEQLIDRCRRRGRAAGTRQASGNPLGTGPLAHRGMDGGAKPVGCKALVVEAHARIVDLDPARNVELVAGERDHTNRYAGRQRLQGNSLAAVSDDATRAGDDR